MKFSDRLKYMFTGTERTRKRAIWLGAQSSRLEGDWRSTILSADRETQVDARILRGRARDLTKNNPYAARYLDLLDTNVIGAKGIQLEPTTKTSAGKLDVETNEAIKEAWNEWGENPSLDGKMSWLELTQTMIRMVAQDGEVFVRKVRTKEGFKIQLIDADFLDIALNSSTNNTSGIRIAQGNRLVQGIEVDKNGVPKWYHFYVVHPDGIATGVNLPKNKRERVNAKDVIHLMKNKNRVSQTRGITWLAPVMWSLHMLVKLQEGELVATRTAANKMGFIETAAENVVPYIPDPADDVDGQFVPEQMEAQPGVIERLPAGDKFVSWDPTHPSTAFESFVRIILQSIATALNISYSTLSGDPNRESFSSAKLHQNKEVDHFKCLQGWVARVVYQNVYEAWLRDAILSGDLKLRSKQVSDFKDVKWIGKAFPSLDSDKESKGVDRMVALGLTTRTAEAAALGSDFRRNIQLIAEEESFAEEHGVVLGSQFKEAEEIEVNVTEE